MNTNSALYTVVNVVMLTTSIAANLRETRMWADAQRDRRPAKHRWHSLLNTAKFG